MNNKSRGFAPPFWILVFIVLLFIGFIVGGIWILLQTGLYYVMGSAAGFLIFVFMRGVGKKTTVGIKRTRR